MRADAHVSSFPASQQFAFAPRSRWCGIEDDSGAHAAAEQRLDVWPYLHVGPRHPDGREAAADVGGTDETIEVYIDHDSEGRVVKRIAEQVQLVGPISPGIDVVLADKIRFS